MKFPLKIQSVLKIAVCLIFFFGSVLSYSQGSNSIPINITWNQETGCQTFKEGKDREDILELIQDGTCIKVCENSYVTYTLTGNVSLWDSNVQWNVGGGTIISSSMTSCTVSWGGVGQGSVSVSIPSQGQIHVREMCIEIINSPISMFGVYPDLSSNEVSVCANETIFFTNMSSSNGGSALYSYYWQFSDGYVSSEFEPTHSFTSPGIYDVKLTVRNSCNCASTYGITVKVLSEGFDITCVSVVCEGERASYSLPENVASLCSDYYWKVEGGDIVANNNSNIQVDWNDVDESGFGYVTFDPAGCDVACPALSVIKIPVIKSSGTIIGETTICQGGQYIYSLPQWPDTEFIWSLEGNGTGSVLVSSDQLNMVNLNAVGSGMVILRAVYTNKLLQCGGVAEIEINIKGTTQIEGPRNLCIGNNIQYTNTSGANVSWTLTGPQGSLPQTGNGTSFYGNFAVAGNYTMSITSAELCETEKLFIKVQPSLNAPQIKNPGSICVGMPVVIGIEGGVNNVPGTVLHWTVVGSGSTLIGSAYGDEITVVYDGIAPFVNQQIIVQRENTVEPFCASTVNIIVPFFVFVEGSVAGNSSVCPSSYETYSVDYAEGDSYEWSVSPPELGSVVGTSTITNSAGLTTHFAEVLWNENPLNIPASIEVRIRKCGTISDPLSLPVIIKSSPSSSIVVQSTTICRGAPMSFHIDNTQLTSWTNVVWNFGNGTTQTLTGPNAINTSFTFNTISTDNIQYTVTATVNGANGCKPIVLQQLINVIPSPVANITPQNHRTFCDTEEINFTLTATAEDGYGITTAADVTWYKNNITNPVGTGFTYQVQSVGTYFAMVTNGYCTSKTNIVNVSQSSCTGTGGCNPQEVTLSGSNISCGRIAVNASSADTPTSFSWSGGSQATVISSTFNHYEASYTTAGMYNVRYSAIINGCNSWKEMSVLVPYIAGVKYRVVCGDSPNTYKVTLLDDSNYFPTITIANRIYKINGNVVHSGPEQEFETTLAAGSSYNFSIEIQGANPDGGNFPSCTASTNLELPNFPNVQVVPLTSQCQNEPIQFSILNGSTDFSYHWDFGDGSYNTLQEPKKTYSSGGTKQITLTVKNSLGCTQQISNIFINVYQTLVNGTLYGPDIACEGETSILNFDQLFGQVPAQSFTWMQGTNQVGYTNSPNFAVTQSGSYWVILTDVNGCTKKFNAVPVVFAKSPPIKVTGPTAVCAGMPFKLTVNPQNDVTYSWSMSPDNSIISTSNSIEQNFQDPGNYSYTVTARATNNGITCSSTATHTVSVLEAPQPFDIMLNLEDCDTYTIRLTANGNGPGSYTWSDGQTGQTIYVTEGGAYRVRFTNPAGCSTASDIFVPRNPEGYLWVFPSGCYNLCEREEMGTLIGPNQNFEEWEWYFNGNSVAGGSGHVQEYAVNQSGTYNLNLNNGLCSKMSDPMDINIQNCECKYKVGIKEIVADNEPFCHYNMHFTIDNPFGYDVTATLSAPNGEGVFVPSVINIPVGGGSFDVSFIPFSNFTGGSIIMAFQSLLKEDKICRYEMKVGFPQSCLFGGRAIGNNILPEESYSLKIVPNPVANKAELFFDFGTSSLNAKNIDIYSINGYRLETYTPKDVIGIWTVNMEKYPSGQYIVIMRENGAIVSQKNLIKK